MNENGVYLMGKCKINLLIKISTKSPKRKKKSRSHISFRMKRSQKEQKSPGVTQVLNWDPKLSDKICPICREPLSTNKKILACKHSFHPECIHEWIKRSPTCPLCRTAIVDIDPRILTMLRKGEKPQDFANDVILWHWELGRGDAKWSGRYRIPEYGFWRPAKVSNLTKPQLQLILDYVRS